uniref:Uncharacterized protein n=1 Tax=Lepeophtheirus salmonis TaxID=72036 RepID=A0A0K2UUZ4_LEPSM
MHGASIAAKLSCLKFEIMLPFDWIFILVTF